MFFPSLSLVTFQTDAEEIGDVPAAPNVNDYVEMTSPDVIDASNSGSGSQPQPPFQYPTVRGGGGGQQTAGNIFQPGGAAAAAAPPGASFPATLPSQTSNQGEHRNPNVLRLLPD